MAELKDLLRDLKTTLYSLSSKLGDHEMPDSTLFASADQLKGFENRLMTRLQRGENFLVNQMDEQGLIITLGTLICIITAFYVFYFLMENMFRLRRCQCLSGTDLEAITFRALSKCIKVPEPVSPAPVTASVPPSSPPAPVQT